MTPAASDLRRTLGVGDAVVIGLGSMIGAGIFAALAPAARAAGSGLLFGLAVAAVVAYCNATSSARLAARYPASGGTYVYGRERLGEFWGHLAGWSFVVGKTASCAAMALTVGAYVWPGQAHAVAVAAVVALTAVNYGGVQKSAWATRLIVAVVLAVLASVVVVSLTSGRSAAGHLDVGASRGCRWCAPGRWSAVLAATSRRVRAHRHARRGGAGPGAHHSPRDPLALGITLVVYVCVAVAVLSVLGSAELGRATAPLADAVRAAGVPGLAPVVRVGAAVAALGSLLALILGVSRTTLAMARDRHIAQGMAAVHPRYRVPHRAELAVGAAVAVLAATVDVRGAVGFSSFGVLAYYAVANASAWTLDSAPASRVVPGVGLVGCLLLAFALPVTSVAVGAGVLVLGAVVYGVRVRVRGRRLRRRTGAS
ncbi:Amino acid transporter OS=Streptomyces fumanus OX=67302 GN=GCM10018772_44900 PE=4 SV=1 [Streptomyces fumanus]